MSISTLPLSACDSLCYERYANVKIWTDTHWLIVFFFVQEGNLLKSHLHALKPVNRRLGKLLYFSHVYDRYVSECAECVLLVSLSAITNQHNTQISNGKNTVKKSSHIYIHILSFNR